MSGRRRAVLPGGLLVDEIASLSLFLSLSLSLSLSLTLSLSAEEEEEEEEEEEGEEEEIVVSILGVCSVLRLAHAECLGIIRCMP